VWAHTHTHTHTHTHAVGVRRRRRRRSPDRRMAEQPDRQRAVLGTAGASQPATRGARLCRCRCIRCSSTGTAGSAQLSTAQRASPQPKASHPSWLIVTAHASRDSRLAPRPLIPFPWPRAPPSPSCSAPPVAQRRVEIAKGKGGGIVSQRQPPFASPCRPRLGLACSSFAPTILSLLRPPCTRSRVARSRRADSRDPTRYVASQHRNIATLRHRNMAISPLRHNAVSVHAASRGERRLGCQSSAVHSQPRVWSRARARNICLSAPSRLRRAVCLPASGRTSEVERIDACRGFEAARSSLGSPPVTRPFNADGCPGLRRISLSQSTLLDDDESEVPGQNA
jgi:hypothetical protein